MAAPGTNHYMIPESMHRSFLYLPILVLLPSVAAAQQPLDHDAYDIWQRISDSAISRDGQWVHYVTSPENGDGVLHIVGKDVHHRIPRGNDPAFSYDARFVVFMINAPRDLVRAAKLAEAPADAMPKDSLGILDMASGSVVKRARIQSFKLPEEGSRVLAYLEEPPLPDTTKADEEPDKEGERLVLFNLDTDQEMAFPGTTDYVISSDGAYLAVAAVVDTSIGGAMLLVNTASMEADTLLSGKGAYIGATFDDQGRQLAFLSDRDDQDPDKSAHSLYLWIDGDVEPLVTPDRLPDGQGIGEDGNLSFSDSGQRLYFGTAQWSGPEEDADEPEDEQVVLDIWSWKDPLLQPMQLVQLDDEQKRTYRAVVHLDSGDMVQLATPDRPSVVVGLNGDADIAIANTNIPYRQQISWDWPRYTDVYAVDAGTGDATLLLSGIQGSAHLSPDANYITWWDREALGWMAMPASGGPSVNLTEEIPHAFHNELHDWPYLPSAYGSAGWTEADGRYLVYDKFDIWAVDPSGSAEPYSVTDGFGRENGLRLRYVRLDADEDAIDPDAPMLLSAFDMETKADGFYRDSVSGESMPQELLMAERRFSTPQRAEDADRLLYRRESFREFGDLWTSDGDFENQRRVSDANPQQADYRWGNAGLVQWTSLDGLPLTGMLFTPDGFDLDLQYPMMVYFYEKMSDGLHQHRPPATARSSISVSFYVSRGYLVFIPDIPYKVGYPGESALNAVVPGVTELINKGIVKEDNIGVQGHSWGGYQIAYMITETNLFKAAEAGAPVSNMTSAYGGIRWASGMSRMFQYERSQSRIGGTLWEYPLRYLDNSPLFQADKINTPVLMLHNDDDGAVPWYQGIEFFVALRRLGKPVWLLNYNGEGHGLGKYQNKRDFAIRMQQFFDHYLQDAPAPVWMDEGVPAIMKGKTLGLEEVPGTQ